MRVGVDREGDHLYPAFPYDHFTKASDSDISAIYAFLMTREPVKQENHTLQLMPPLNWRLFAAAWKLLFLDTGAYQPDTAQSADWNRGAYLVAGLGHCGACHTPRNALGAEKDSAPFAGGEGEGWRAPALNASSPAPVPWSAEQLYTYLRNGFADQHGYAAGPMQPVVRSLRKVPDGDVKAIATYVATLGPQDTAQRQRQTQAALEFARERAVKVSAAQTASTTGAAPSANGNGGGAVIFAGACASCHHSGGALPVSRPIELGLSTPVNEPDPTDLIRLVLDGIHPPLGERGPIMPGFAGALTDPQMAALVSYVRSQYSRQPAWADVAATVSKLRQKKPPAMEAP
jgi:mono/diheme cytochrome c family protein